MNTGKPAGIPPRLLVLDAIGTVLLVLGLIERFSEGGSLFGKTPPFPGHDLALVALKIGMDIMLHRRSHRPPAPQGAETQAADNIPRPG